MNNNQPIITDELLAAFLDGNVTHQEAQSVLSLMNDDNELAEIISLSPIIDAEVELQQHHSILPMHALAASNPQNLCSFNCETHILQRLNFDIDHWTLLETAKANHWVREEGTPLHLVGKLLELKGVNVERKYDSTIQDIRVALQNNKQVIAIIDHNILEHRSSSSCPAYHAIYLTEVKNNGTIAYLNLDTQTEENIESEIFLKAWKCSGNYMVVASSHAGSYNPQPINVDDICLDADLEELTEAIAENAHDIWARARMDEGWTYGPVRDDAKKHHPDLIPYAQLPDSEKQYDRLMAMNTLRLVHRLGFGIIK